MAPHKRKKSFLTWGLCPQTPGIFRDPAIPGCQIKTKRGGYRRHRPGLAPESALRLHPCRALSSAEARMSLDRAAALRNAPGHNRSVNFGASAPEARPQKTGARSSSGISGSREPKCMDSAWVYCVCFWTGRWRWITALESGLRFPMNSGPLD